MIRPGALVQLRSGGPIMVVVARGSEEATVMWTLENGDMREATVPLVVLTLRQRAPA